MPIRVQAEPLPEGAALRALVLESLDAVLGRTAVLDEALPLEGAPALVLDGEGRATVVSFDREDAGRAVLAGLKALEALAGAGPWLAGSYPVLAEPALLAGLGLLALGPALPPGLGRVGTPPRLTVGAFRCVRVGEETGLLIDLVAPTPPEAQTAAVARVRPFRTGFVSLSDAEEAFFEGL